MNKAIWSYIVIGVIICISSTVVSGCRYCPLNYLPIQAGTDSSSIDSIMRVFNMEHSYLSPRTLGNRTVMSLCRKITGQDKAIAYLSENSVDDSLGYISIVLFIEEGKLSLVRYIFPGSQSIKKGITDVLRLYEIMITKIGIPSKSNYTRYKESRISFLDSETQSLAVWRCGSVSVVLTIVKAYGSEDFSQQGCLVPFAYYPIIRIVNDEKWPGFGS